MLSGSRFDWLPDIGWIFWPYGNPGGAVRATVTLATSLHWARNRNDPAGVSGPRDRFQRSLAVPACEVVRDVLSRIQNAPLIGQGLAAIAGCAAARAWTDRSYPASRRSPSPIRTARSLKLLEPIPVRNGDKC